MPFRSRTPRQPGFPGRTPALVALFLAAGLLPVGVVAQPAATGERWRVTASLEGRGMSMPATTSEACLPRDRPEEAMQQPLDDDASCRVSDLERKGNRSSGRFACERGRESIQGSFEVITESNRIRSTLQMTTPDGPMTIRNDATRLGTACPLPVAKAPPPPPPPPPVAAMPDLCRDQAQKLRTEPQRAADAWRGAFHGKGLCHESRHREGFCAALATPDGYASMWQFDTQLAGTDELAAQLRGLYGRPLLEAAGSCGHGRGDGAVAQLRLTAIESSRKVFADGSASRGAGTVLLAQGTDADYTTVREAARRLCSGRLSTFTMGQRIFDFCSDYGAALARDDRAAVRQIAAMAPAERAGADTASPGSGTAASAGASRPGTAAPAGAANAPEPGRGVNPANAVGDLLRRGRGVLDGLLGPR
jgi:hypothetical protein